MVMTEIVTEERTEGKHRITMAADLTDAQLAAVKFMARVWNEKPEETLAQIGTQGIYGWLEVVEGRDTEVRKLKDALRAEGHS